MPSRTALTLALLALLGAEADLCPSLCDAPNAASAMAAAPAPCHESPPDPAPAPRPEGCSEDCPSCDELTALASSTAGPAAPGAQLSVFATHVPTPARLQAISLPAVYERAPPPASPSPILKSSLLL